MIILLIIGAVLCGLLAIFTDRDEQRPKIFYLLKPLTTILILAVAFVRPADSVAYQHWILLALVLSLAGDVSLMFKSNRWFLAGLSSFLLAHLAFVAAFLSGLAHIEPPLWSYAVLLWGMAMLRVLWPRAGALKIPVLVYGAALAAMTLTAAARHAALDTPASLYALCGAWLFMLSDSLLGYRQFVRRYAGAQPLILTTYWAAIGLIAWSV